MYRKLSLLAFIFILIGVFLPFLFSVGLPKGKPKPLPSVTAKAIFAVN